MAEQPLRKGKAAGPVPASGSKGSWRNRQTRSVEVAVLREEHPGSSPGEPTINKDEGRGSQSARSDADTLNEGYSDAPSLARRPSSCWQSPAL